MILTIEVECCPIHDPDSTMIVCAGASPGDEGVGVKLMKYLSLSQGGAEPIIRRNIDQIEMILANHLRFLVDTSKWMVFTGFFDESEGRLIKVILSH